MVVLVIATLIMVVVAIVMVIVPSIMVVVAIIMVIVPPVMMIVSPATAIFSPMVAVSFVAAIADNSLVMTTSEIGVTVSDVCMMLPWITLVNYNLVGVVSVEVTISCR